MIRCRLCGTDGPPAKAHIEPDGFFRAMRDGKGRLSTLDLDDPASDRLVQSGPWDRTILCQGCEGRFSPLDTYGIRFFRDEAFPLTRIPEDFGDVLIAEGVDQGKLQKFLLFLAWRVGVSQRPWFTSVNFGDRLGDLAAIVLVDQPVEPRAFPVVLKRYDGEALIVRDGWNVPIRASDIHLNPCVKEWAGRRVLQVYLGEYAAYMAIDDVIPEGFWATHALGATLKPIILAKPFCRSAEFKFLLRIPQLRRGSRPRERAGRSEGSGAAGG